MLTTIAIITSLATIASLTHQVGKLLDAFEQNATEALTEAYEADINHDLQYGRVDEKQLKEEAYTSF